MRDAETDSGGVASGEALNKLISQLEKELRGSISQRALAKHLLSEFGGARQIAKLIKAQYDSAPDGSSMKVMIAKLVMETVLSLRGEEASPLAHLSRDQLMAIIAYASREQAGTSVRGPSAAAT